MRKRSSTVARVTAAGIAVAAAIALAGPAGAQDTRESTNRVASETHWAVFVEENPKECWGVSAARESVNTRDGRVAEVRRGDTLLYVYYAPGPEHNGVVSFTGGYPFAENSMVTLEVGETTYELFTKGEWAWPASPGDDSKIVASLKRGTAAVLTGRSSRGTQTQDTFSLLGFTAAMEEAEKRCTG